MPDQSRIISIDDTIVEGVRTSGALSEEEKRQKAEELQSLWYRRGLDVPHPFSG